MEIMQLVGIQRRSYEVDGVQKTYCGLHFVSPSGEDRETEGSTVSSISCPREIDPARLTVGTWYEFIYTHYRTAKGTMARLVDLKPVEV